MVMGGMLLLSAPDAGAVQYSRITASAMDSQGNTYVTGWHVIEETAAGDDYLVDIVTIKYDKYGNQVWADHFPRTVAWGQANREAEAWGIAVDRDGNIYVAGHIGVPVNDDCLILKYAASHRPGDGPEWVRIISGDAGRHDQFWNVAAGADGFVYVTGRITETTPTGYTTNLITIKYAPNGDEVWRSIYDGPDKLADVGLSVAVDPGNRNVFVTGYSYRSTPAGTRASMATLMYDAASGAIRWVRRYDGPVNGHNEGVSLALDPEGNVYVSGWSQGTGSFDFATIKYDVNGNEKWVARYDGPANGHDQAAPYAVWSIGGSTAMYIQSNLGIHVTAEIIDPIPALDYLMERVEATGLERGHFACLRVLEEALRKLSVHSSSNHFDAANMVLAFLHKVEALRKAGQISEADAVELTDIGTHIRQSILRIPTYVVYVLGQSTGVGTAMDVALLKYNAETGRPMWNLPGQPGTAPDKPGTPANIAWRYNGPLNGNDRGMAMAFNADGELYLSAVAASSPAATTLQMVDMFTVKLAVNTYRPSVLAQHLFVGEGMERDHPCTIAVWQDPVTGRRGILRDPVLGDLVVIGGNAGLKPAPALPWMQYFTIAYDGNLVPRWTKAYE
jgi:hypothetical protein